MDYAVIRTGGKQYRVSLGDIIEVEKLAGQPGDTVTFSDVLLEHNAGKVILGTPLVKGLSVSGKVLDQFKHDKIRVMKFKAKSRYRRTTGHRQQLTRVEINAIGANKAKSAAPAAKTSTEKTPEKKLAVKKAK